MKKHSTFIGRQKNNFILHVFLVILQRYCKLVVFGTLRLSGFAHQKWYYHLAQNVCVYLQEKKIKKISFILCASMEIFQGYAKLFWVLWACMVALIQNDSIILQKSLTFICMQKIHFIIHFFLRVLYFKESCKLIG